MTNRPPDIMLDDFLNQIEAMLRIGSMEETFRTIPGMGQSVEVNQSPESEMRRIKGMIHAMTPTERADQSVMTQARLSRIAKGSGTRPEEVSKMIEDFQKMRAMLSTMAIMNVQQRLLNEMKSGR